ncbi:MAG: GNAT family N-acetyltransferase [Clostridiales bacterium]|jgi:ribosomal protein S18 acetylase RimI-like enzyme|nr:GNAT family N-acetyltransferase [Clostridiales bacterium]
MLIRWATESDLPAWYALATEVSAIFQHTEDMGADPDFIAYGKKAVNEYKVLVAVEYTSGSRMGFISISRTKNAIAWFAVSKPYRGQGAGEHLLKTALRQLDTNKDITVTTFPANYPPGAAARALYKKYSFTVDEPTTFNGLARSLLTRPADGEKFGGSSRYHP